MTPGPNYPVDWDTRRREVIQHHSNRCANCHHVGGLNNLEVHHIVPVCQAGSHQKSNLVPLCEQCHEAAHRNQMAPAIRWYTNGDLDNREFAVHKALWKDIRDRLGVPRYDPDEDCVYIPVADKNHILDNLPA